MHRGRHLWPTLGASGDTFLYALRWARSVPRDRLQIEGLALMSVGTTSRKITKMHDAFLPNYEGRDVAKWVKRTLR